MYLMPANSGAVNNRKWNLGRLGCNCSSRGIGVPPQKRLRGLHRMGLGDASACVYYGADGVTVESVDQSSNPTECSANGGVWGPSPTTTTPAAPAGVPTGSTVLYTCTFTPTSNPLSAKFYSLDSVIAAVVQSLQAQWGLAVTAQQSSGAIVGTPSATLTLQTNTSYAQLSDLKAIVDGAFYNAAGAQVTSSQMQITKLGAVASSSAGSPIGNPVVAAAQQSSITSWFSSNLPLLGLGLLGLVAVKEL